MWMIVYLNTDYYNSVFTVLPNLRFFFLFFSQVNYTSVYSKLYATDGNY